MQKNNNPIGIFDSGLGGLTVMSEIIKIMPEEDIIYFGDTAHVPYGSKSREMVTKFSMDIVEFLFSKKVKLIIAACNTASAFALDKLKNTFKIPILGVIEPGAEAALKSSKNKKIGVIGTEGTIKSHSYTEAINKIDNSAIVSGRACPLFVPLVEEGWLKHKATTIIAEEYLKPFITDNIDTLVLGCTHYPLIKETIQDVVGKSIKLIDSAESTAYAVKNMLSKNNSLKTNGNKGNYTFFVSDTPEKFKKIGCLFLGQDISPVKRIRLE